MSNCLEGAGKYFLEQTDFDGAIAACTDAIDKAKTAMQAPQIGDYLIRAYARCCATGDNAANYDKAIEDCSTVLSMIGTNYSQKHHGTAFRIRAFAYYLKGDYATALNDCNWVLDAQNKDYADEEDRLFVRELRARIHFNMQKYEQVIDDCRNVIPVEVDNINPNIFPTLSIAETFLQACEKLQYHG